LTIWWWLEVVVELVLLGVQQVELAVVLVGF
jgi:hypothetical protein